MAPGGLARGVGLGTTPMAATFQALTALATLTVVQSQSVLTSLTIAPGAAVLFPGGTQQLTVTGHYGDGSSNDLTSAAAFVSSNLMVATVAPGGLATGLAAGTSLITASVGALNASMNLTVAEGITITSPLAGFLTNGTDIEVRGSYGSGVIAVDVNGVPAALSGGVFVATVPLREGRNTLSAIGRTATGAASAISVTVSRDTTPPLVNIESPTAGAILTVRQITVTGMINDIVSGTVNPEQAQVMVNGLPAVLLNRSYAITDLLLTPGRNIINVVARDRAGNETQRSIEVTVMDAALQKRINRLAGDAQSGMIGTTLEQPLVVELVDANGVVQTNQPVTFNICRNDGTLLAPPDQQGRTITRLTDTRGQAQIFFQLGSRTGAGNNQVDVTSPGVLGQVIFCANATGSPPVRISALLPETQVGETGKPLPLPWTAYVTDLGGNPVAGAPVTFIVFQGDGGTVNGTTMITTNSDSDGRAAVVHTLGGQDGLNNNVVIAMIGGLTNAAATFTASGRTPHSVALTRVVGLVLDNANQPMSNILCRIDGTSLETFTDAQGQFVLSNAPVGNIHLVVDARDRGYPGTWHALEFVVDTVAGRDNSVDRPIYMLPLSDSALAGGSQPVTLQMRDMPGASMTILPGSIRDANGRPVVTNVSFTQVNMERVPMPPPLGSQFMLAWTVQPAGLHFDPPASMCIPNMGAPAGQVVEMFSFDHDLIQFVAIGTATVTTDGALMCSDPGFGVSKSGWGGCVPPPPPCTPVCSGPPRPRQCVTYQTIPPASRCGCPTYRPMFLTGSCDDGDECTINDRCQNGTCKGDKVTVNSIMGPCVAGAGSAVTFTADSNAPDRVKWIAIGGSPSSGMGASFSTTFAGGLNFIPRFVVAYCGFSAKTKALGVGPSCASIMPMLNEIEVAMTPGASSFGQVHRLAHSADYEGCVDANKWCFRLERFTEKHGIGTQSLGRTDISGAFDSDVTPATCRAIIADLTPPAAGAGMGPPRSTYYSQGITLAHENFHVSDFRDKVSTPTMNDLAVHVAMPSNCTDCKSSPPGSFNTQMETIWNMHRPTYFDGNHEVRAHNHSNPMYTALINAIRARARNAPAAEAWPADCK